MTTKSLNKRRRLENDSCIKENESSWEKVNKKKKKQIPVFHLKTAGDAASVLIPANDRVPLVLTDIQHLLLHSLLGNLNISEKPRWYAIDKCNNVAQTTCLVLEGVSINHFQKLSDTLEETKKIFSDFVEVVTPSAYNGSLVQELALVPLSETEKEDIIQKYGSMNLALEARKDLMTMMRAVFPIADDSPVVIDPDSKDQFPRTQLVLSAWQLIEEGYPVPLKGKLKIAYSDYVMSKDEYKPVTAESPMFGLDCEMCITNAGSELTRVSLVNEKHETVYESFVKPYNEITDYLTRFSGITKSLLADVSKRLEDVQKELREILPPDAILVGHSLNGDLHALKMMHPYVIDTSVIYNFTGERTRKPKLKALAKEFLHEDIQTGGRTGHCPTEDSIASLKLAQLKLSKSIEYGDAVHTNRQKYKENVVKLATAKEYALSIFNHMIENKITSVVVGCDDITGDYHTYLTQAKDSLSMQLKKGKLKKVKLNTVDDKEEVITTITEAVKEYNFAMGHLKMDVGSESHMKVIDRWISSIWKSVPQCGLFTVLMSGTESDNGLAMMTVKSTV